MSNEPNHASARGGDTISPESRTDTKPPSPVILDEQDRKALVGFVREVLGFPTAVPWGMLVSVAGLAVILAAIVHWFDTDTTSSTNYVATLLVGALLALAGPLTSIATTTERRKTLAKVLDPEFQQDLAAWRASKELTEDDDPRSPEPTDSPADTDQQPDD